MFEVAARAMPMGSMPEMIAEAAILDGDEGVGHIGGQVGDLDLAPWVKPRRAISRPLSSSTLMSCDVFCSSRFAMSGSWEIQRKYMTEPKIAPQATSSRNTKGQVRLRGFLGSGGGGPPAWRPSSRLGAFCSLPMGPSRNPLFTAF